MRLFWIAVPSLFVSTLYLSPLANADVMTLGSLSERATVNFDQDASAFADQISMSATPASASYSGSVTDPNVGVQFTASGKSFAAPAGLSLYLSGTYTANPASYPNGIGLGVYGHSIADFYNNTGNLLYVSETLISNGHGIDLSGTSSSISSGMWGLAVIMVQAAIQQAVR